MQSTQTSLVITGLHTPTAKIFFNGTQIPGIVAIKADWEDDEYRVKLRVTTNPEHSSLYDELRTIGIIVKEV